MLTRISDFELDQRLGSEKEIDYYGILDEGYWDRIAAELRGGEWETIVDSWQPHASSVHWQQDYPTDLPQTTRRSRCRQLVHSIQFRGSENSSMRTCYVRIHFIHRAAIKLSPKRHRVHAFGMILKVTSQTSAMGMLSVPVLRPTCVKYSALLCKVFNIKSFPCFRRS